MKFRGEASGGFTEAVLGGLSKKGKHLDVSTKISKKKKRKR